MEGLWIIIVIVILVFRVLNKAGEITGQMKERFPEGLGEKRFPPVIKDWGFPWDEDNEWEKESEHYPEPSGQGARSPQNTAENTTLGTLRETTRETGLGTPAEITVESPMENVMGTPGNLQRENGAAGFEKYPLLDSASLVNGLILSELLQPPKCRRLGRRF